MRKAKCIQVALTAREELRLELERIGAALRALGTGVKASPTQARIYLAAVHEDHALRGRITDLSLAVRDLAHELAPV